MIIVKVFIILISFIPTCLAFSLTQYCLQREYSDASVAFGMIFAFSIIGYLLFVFNIFTSIP